MFVLQPKPVFTSDVIIPTPSGDGKITFEFKHMGRKALKAFLSLWGMTILHALTTKLCLILLATGLVWMKSSPQKHWKLCLTTTPQRPKLFSRLITRGCLRVKEKTP
jgi:hypothetical protein